MLAPDHREVTVKGGSAGQGGFVTGFLPTGGSQETEAPQLGALGPGHQAAARNTWEPSAPQTLPRPGEGEVEPRPGRRVPGEATRLQVGWGWGSLYEGQEQVKLIHGDRRNQGPWSAMGTSEGGIWGTDCMRGLTL